MIFESVFACLDFHDLDFVEAPAAPGPRKSGVGVWISVGLKVSCSHAMFFVCCRGRFGVFQKCVYKMWSPTPTRSIFGGIHISFWWLGHIPLLTIHIPMFNDSTVVVDDEFPYILWFFLKWGMIPKSQSWSNLGWFEGTLKFPNIHTTYLITLTCVLLCSTHPPATSRPSWIY